MLSKGIKEYRNPEPFQKQSFKNTYNKKTMKTQNTNFFQSLGKVQLDNLVKEVKETVAVNVAQVNQKNAFGVVDLWNLERSRKTRVARRHFA